ncbi:MAG: N-acetylmuramoyl-L-alanine amidase [Nitrospirota bacterium]|jgi:N-acetylmuramoyl-L-alanine amidase
MRPRGVPGAAFLLVVLVSLLSAFSFPAGAAGSPATVREVRYWSSRAYTRVVVELDRSTSYVHNRLKSPDRLYIDFKGTEAAENAQKNIAVKDGLLRRVRSSQYDDRTVRVVLDLAEVEHVKVFELSDPPRVVIDVFGKPETMRKHRVVLDPGHGGKDPGAIGPGRLMEKDVVLDVARRVKHILERRKHYEVFLTRDGDRFLSLEERTVLANKKGADLFVSVHANANRSRRLRGLETYLLNWTDDREAMKVAARENRITLKRMEERRSEVGLILASLELQNKRDESLKLAHFIQDSTLDSLTSRYARVEDNGVKQALFYVLFGAHMPSVLVEISYITNREEAARLRTASYREQLARGIARGIEEYFTKPAAPNTFARR